jgi:hypothetical protein
LFGTPDFVYLYPGISLLGDGVTNQCDFSVYSVDRFQDRLRQQLVLKAANPVRRQPAGQDYLEIVWLWLFFF